MSKRALLTLGGLLLLVPAGGRADHPGTAPVVADLHGVRTASPVPCDRGVMSGYGVRTGRRTGEETFHAGLDLAAPRGTAVYAAADGEVVFVASDEDETAAFGGYGNAVVIHHASEGVSTMYAHLSDAAVAVGSHVEAGALIGHSGSTTNGRFPGMVPHLHFEVRRDRADGSPAFPAAYRRYNRDPRAWLRGRGIVFERDGAHVALAGELEAHHAH